MWGCGCDPCSTHTHKLTHPHTWVVGVAHLNFLANQAYNAFSAVPEDAMVRIAPDGVRKKGRVPTNGSLFFTIFQTFMCGPPKPDGTPSPYFGQYPPDFFDFIVIDECHRGGANDESNWREIMEYYKPAVGEKTAKEQALAILDAMTARTWKKEAARVRELVAGM